MLVLVKYLKLGFISLLALQLYACGGGDEYNGFDSTIKPDEPNKFLTFFNRQGELAPGQYTLVVATETASQVGSLSVVVSRNDGSADQLLTGSWIDSFNHSDPITAAELASSCTGATANVCFTVEIPEASGATFTLTTAVNGLLYLLDDSDTVQLVGQTTANGSGVPVILKFDESNIDKPTYAAAYYAAVDPANARDTLQKYRSLHGFDSTAGPDVNVIFRDSKDLGYGRDMYMRSYPNVTVANGGCGGQVMAFYVQNFSVSIIDGFAYGPVNLEGAIEQDLQYHFGTNAIEFSRGIQSAGDVCSPEPIAKFYTYRSDYSSPGAVHPRIETVDLDARGEKAMPQPCISCHGGKLRPLDRFGRFVGINASDPVTQIGDTKSSLQAFEVDTFEFSDKAGHTKAEAEENLRKLNAAVFCSYPGSAGSAACTNHGGGIAAQTNLGEWSGDFSSEMLVGWYGNNLEVPGTTYDNTFVPPGWQPVVGVTPSGADVLFKKVVGPNCIVCHGKSGSELGSNNNANTEGKDLDFSSWSKFISHADEIERLVFDEGKMPLGLLNYNNFWGDPEKAELLASFIVPYATAGFNTRHQDANGKVIRPGRVVARAGLDRVTQPNAPITLNAGASLFANSYNWSLVSSPAGSAVTILSPGAIRTDFSADLEGDYTLRLTARYSTTGQSKTDDVLVRIDSTLAKAPRSLTFYNDITAELINCANTCHSNGGGTTGAAVSDIPVWWSAAQPQATPTTTASTPSLGLYEQALATVNLEDIADSLILKKSSGIHHYGDQRAGFNTALSIGTGGRAAYDLFVNWISEGAVCGGTTTECPL